jgi:hypothetical protein
MTNFWTARRRAWFYGIATAAVPVLTTYGLVTADQGGVWLMLVAAVLGTGSPALALRNVTPDEEV